MITFNLRCSNNHEFEGWFKDSASFDAQVLESQVECPACGDRSIAKALSAPNISTSRKQAKAEAEVVAVARQMVRQMRETVESNCDNVGEKFAEEARKIHYGEVEARGIYGKATADEAAELVEEGVEFAPLPWLDDDKAN